MVHRESGAAKSRRRAPILVITILLLAALFGIEFTRARAVVIDEDLAIGSRDLEAQAQTGVRYLDVPAGEVSSVELSHDGRADVAVHLALVSVGPTWMLSPPEEREVREIRPAVDDVAEALVTLAPGAKERVFLTQTHVDALRVDARTSSATQLRVTARTGDRHPGAFAVAALMILIPGLILAKRA